MFLFLIITLVIFLVVFTYVLHLECDKNGFPHKTWISIFLVLALILGVPYASRKNAVDESCEYVTTIDNIDIYVEEPSGKYFVTNCYPWQMFPMSYREYLNANMVEEYLAHKEAMDQIPLFDGIF